jgi:hypothetical protein
MNQTKSMTLQEQAKEMYLAERSNKSTVELMVAFASQFKPEPGEVFTRQDMEKMFVAGLLNRSDFTMDEFEIWLKYAEDKIDRLIKDLKP